MPVAGRPRLVSKQPNAAKLFVDDRREIIALSANENKQVGVVIRELVHEALRARRLQSIGRNEGDDFVRKIHQETLSEAIGPLLAEIDKLRQTIEKNSASDKSEFESHSAVNPTLISLITEVLSRVLIGESITKVLMTVGMLRDNVKLDEIKARLAVYDEDGYRQARATARKILAESKSQNTSVDTDEAQGA